jgi:trk system potassium uptake protein TrkH
VSALGTVGLSAGVTDQLSRLGQVVLIASMFLGRIGPVTLALVMARSGEVDLYRYARERVTLG